MQGLAAWCGCKTESTFDALPPSGERDSWTGGQTKNPAARPEVQDRSWADSGRASVSWRGHAPAMTPVKPGKRSAKLSTPPRGDESCGAKLAASLAPESAMCPARCSLEGSAMHTSEAAREASRAMSISRDSRRESRTPGIQPASQPAAPGPREWPTAWAKPSALKAASAVKARKKDSPIAWLNSGPAEERKASYTPGPRLDAPGAPASVSTRASTRSEIAGEGGTLGLTFA
eukprot:scaffold23366_cov112-Isochrysis_galbana.AAC.6